MDTKLNLIKPFQFLRDYRTKKRNAIANNICTVYILHWTMPETEIKITYYQIEIKNTITKNITRRKVLIVPIKNKFLVLYC